MAVSGYVSHDNVNNNVLKSLHSDWLRSTSEFLITSHLFCAVTIVFNPFAQHCEDIFHVPHGELKELYNETSSYIHLYTFYPDNFQFFYFLEVFCGKRVLLRSALMLCILFVAASVPHFGAILDLIGGSTVCFLTFVAPSLFYMKLCSMPGDWPQRYSTLYLR